MKIVDRFQVFFINAYWFGFAIMWNSLNTVVVPAMLVFFVPEALKNTYLAVLTSVGLIIAMIVQPLSGAISDNWISRWGRRRPMILAGTIGIFIFLSLLGYSSTLVMIFITFFCLQISSNTAQGPLQGLLPDVIPSDKIGIASSIKILMEMVGTVIGMLALSKLIAPGEGARNPTTAMFAIIAVLAFCASLTLMFSKEESTIGKKRKSLNIGAILRETFIVWNVKAPDGYWRLIISRFFFLLAVTGIQSFAFNFIRDKLGAENPVKTTADLMAAIVGALTVFAFVSGLLISRIGEKRLLISAGIIGLIGASSLLFAQTTTHLLIFGSIFGAGTGIFLCANWSLANNMAQGEDAGKLMGLSNLATAGAPAVARLFMGPMIDLLNGMRTGQWLGYTMSFIIASLTIIISTVLLNKVKDHKTQATTLTKKT